MSTKRDYYEILEVSRSASEAELKKAYRRLAMKFHPDRNTGDKESEEKFKEVKEAYEVLSDKRKRDMYDQFGHAGVQGGAGGGGFGGFGDIFGDFSEIFGDMFGGGGARGRSRSQRGNDLGLNYEISLEQAIHGATAEITVPRMAECKTCHGSGAKPGSTPVTCRTCSGVGQVRLQQGFFTIQQTCPDCQGEGKTISDPCRDCRGVGRIQERKTLSVKIPPGVDNGDRIRLGGEGEAGSYGAPPGDLYVQIRIKTHPIFERDGQDLFCEVPISLTMAALGGEIEVPTMDGHVKLKIPAETQSGKIFRLRGKGIRSVNRRDVGDLMCRVAVETPVRLTDAQKKLLKELEATLAEGGDKHNPRRDTWFDSVREFFQAKK